MTVVNPDGTPWFAEFPTQRPPFQPGNQLAVKHGARTESKVAPLAAEIRERILTNPAMQYLTEPQYEVPFERYCRAAARVRLVDEWVDAMDFATAARSDRGQTSPLELLRKYDSSLITHATRCGLDPLSFMKLFKDSKQAQLADTAITLTQLRADHERALHGDHAPDDHAISQLEQAGDEEATGHL